LLTKKTTLTKKLTKTDHSKKKKIIKSLVKNTTYDNDKKLTKTEHSKKKKIIKVVKNKNDKNFMA